jgi:serine/threonine protein phosphatase PrpC
MDQTYENSQELPPPGGSPDDPCRMLGTGAAGEPGHYDFQMREDDLLLLCTDGLHRFVPETVIHRIINNGAQSGRSVREIVAELVGKAQQAGSYDDITVLLLHRKRPRWRIWALVVTASLLAASAIAVNVLCK